jgi:hypothetical protein
VPSLLYTLVVRSPQPRLRRARPWAWLLLLAALLAGPLAPPASAQALLLLRVIGGFFEPKAPVPDPGPSAPPVPGSMPEAQFQELLLKGDLQALNQACLEAASFDFNKRLRLLQTRLLAIAPAPQPLQTVLVNANALISCRAPDGALAVLNRFSPLPGVERDQWLVQRWRAAQAGLHHAMAAETLEQLAKGNPANLETLALPMKLRDDGTIATRSGLDVYVDHLLVLERRRDAAQALLAGQMPGKPAAERLRQAVLLLTEMPLQERDQLLERALDQAAAAEAWGLAIELLDHQRRMLEAEGALAARPRERLERLSQRVDDAYSAWQLARQDPQQSERSAQLQQQLRSPRAAGGHAALLQASKTSSTPTTAAPTLQQP